MQVYVKAPEGRNVRVGNAMEAQMVASPGGGHWTTTQDMLRLGDWLQEKWKSTDKGKIGMTFQELVKKYGREFYNDAEQAIYHGGQVPSGSAYFYTSLRKDTPSTMVVLFDQWNGKMKMLSVISNHVCQKPSLEQKMLAEGTANADLNFHFKLATGQEKPANKKTSPDDAAKDGSSTHPSTKP